MIATVGSIRRGFRNVVRNPIRLILVMVLLGASLTFTAAMLALNSGAQNQINQVRTQVGTAMTVSPANSFGSFVNGVITQKQVNATESTAGIVSVTENVEQRYTGSNIKGTAKVSKAFQQFGFQRSGSPPPSGGSNPFGGGGRGSGKGGFTYRRRQIGAGKGGTIEPQITGVTGAANGISLQGGTVHMAKGSDLSAADASKNVAVMSEALAKANKLSIGSTFKLSGKKVTLIGEYTIAGVTSASTGNPFGGSTFAANSIVTPIKLAENIFKLNGITSMTAYADTASHVNALTTSLQSKLGSSVTVTNSAATYASTFSDLDSTSHNIQAALIASIITAALVIIFAVFIIVRERTREIGVLKAIGASSLNIVTQFTSEVLGMSIGGAAIAAVGLAIFGGQIAKIFSVSTAQASTSTSRFGGFFGGGSPGGGFSGTPIATPFSRLLHPITTTPLSAGLNGDSLLALLGLAIALAVLASWIPTWYVSRLQPARVLSNA